MKLYYLMITILTGALLIYPLSGMPDWGDPHSPASLHVSPRYIEKAMEETEVPNMVTAVLADYRGFDTFGETTVIFTAAIACLLVLRKRNKKKGFMTDKHGSIIIKTISRIIAPFIQLFALYVIMHGHISPGGGFQGGVILGASFILLAISFGIDEIKQRFAERVLTTFTSMGVFIYAGIGLICFILGSNFFDYGILPVIEPRGIAMLGIEIGVGITVMAVMVSIFSDLSTHE